MVKFTKFIKKSPLLAIIIFTTFIAFLVRFAFLGKIPHGITWDEAAIGYNGFAVVKTFRDEWLIRMPLSFRSFDDYKAPLPIYISGIFTAILGLSPFSVRLPFAIAGVLTVPIMMLWIYKIFPKKFSLLASTAVGIFLALSPWHMHFTRVGFESGLSLFFVSSGLLATEIMFSKKRFLSYLAAAVASSTFVFSLYTYHSPKLTVPILFVVLVWWYRKKLLGYWKQILLAGIIGTGLVSGLVYDSLYGKALSRSGVFFFSEGTTPLSFLTQLTHNIAAHFTPAYLLFGEAESFRHAPGHWGILLWTTLVCLIFGVGLLVYSKKIRTQFGKYFLLGFLFLVAGLLPAVLSNEVPHQNRSFLALIGYGVLLASSIASISVWTPKKYQYKFLASILGLHLITASIFLYSYFTTFPALSTAAFQDGYLEAMKIVNDYENGVYGPPPEHIRFDDTYGQPYIYALFSKEATPYQYHWYGALHRYVFISHMDIGDLMRDNELLVSTYREDLPLGEVNHLVYGADGSIRFMIIKTKDRE